MKPIPPLASLLMVICMPSVALAFTESQPGAASPNANAIHTVRVGDCFDKIARANDCSVADLAAANGLPTDAILQLGQQLKLPASPATPVAEDIPTANQVPSTPSPVANPSHTIQPGDTYSKIAKQYKVSVDSLIAANPTLKPTALRPGQKILLPDTGETMVQDMPEEVSDSAKITEPVTDNQQSPPNIAADAIDETGKADQILIHRTARTVATDREMTYGELATLYGTETQRLNSLNGLDLQPSTVVVKGADLLVPVSLSR